MKKILFRLGLIALLVSRPAWSAEQDYRFTSIRLLGMGGAGVALTYDENALYKNPAGLAKASFNFKLPHIRAEAATSLTDKQETFKKISLSFQGIELKDELTLEHY